MNNSEELLNHIEKENKCYYCSNCETNFIAETSLKNCVFCNNDLQDNLNKNNIKYNYIIPFKKSKNDFISLAKKHLSKKIFISNKFNLSKNIDNVLGVYVPICFFDFETNGEVNFECKKITKFKSKKNKYIKTDSHLVTIGGSINFNDVDVCTSKIGTHDILNSYDFSESKEFNPSYLNDYIVEDKCLKVKDIINLGELKVKKIFIEKLQKEVKNYDFCNVQDNSINVNNKKKNCVLVPLWIFKINYKGKIYNIFANGQTGKIFENIPVSRKKIFLIWLLLFVASFSLLFILFNYKVIL